MKKMIAIAMVLMLCISALSISAFAADTFTVTVEMDSGSAPYAWAWGSYGNAFPVAWPGVVMSGADGVWEIDVPMGTTGFIVNNGSGTQTSNIAIPGTGDVTIKVSADYKSYEVVGYVAPTPDGYYVTGSSDVFGNWAEFNEAGKMTEEDGIFVKTFTGVPAGDYKLKVNDGTWNNSWGKDGQDYEFSVAEANSTVTVKFNPAESSVVVIVNDEEPTPDPEPIFNGYYVAGSAGLCGVEWDCAAEANKMEEGTDGVWTKTYTGVAAGDYSLKVTDGTWTNSWGGNGENGNYDFNVAGDNATVIVSFNSADNTVSVEIEGVEVTPDPDPIVPNYYVTGSGEAFSNWTECNENGKMTEEDGVYVKVFEGVPAGAYELKVNDGTWSNSWGFNGENVKFNVANDGTTVTVTFNPADYSVNVSGDGVSFGGSEPEEPAPEYDSYYVTGNTDWLSGWTECNENGKMLEDNGVYVKVFENVPAGSVQLKVNVGNWSNAWGYEGNNFCFDVAEGDTVTVTFNPETQTVSVAINGVNYNPGTGDVSVAGLGIALLAATAGVVALVGKKKEF